MRSAVSKTTSPLRPGRETAIIVECHCGISCIQGESYCQPDLTTSTRRITVVCLKRNAGTARCAESAARPDPYALALSRSHTVIHTCRAPSLASPWRGRVVPLSQRGGWLSDCRRRHKAAVRRSIMRGGRRCARGGVHKDQMHRPLDGCMLKPPLDRTDGHACGYDAIEPAEDHTGHQPGMCRGPIAHDGAHTQERA